MARKRSIHLEGMPHGVPIPNAAVIGNVLMSGSVSGRDLDKGEVPEDAEAEIRCLFDNIRKMLALADFNFDDVIKLEFAVKDRAIRSVLDPVWCEIFPDAEDRPARHVVQSSQVGGGQIQCSVYAVKRP